MLTKIQTDAKLLFESFPEKLVRLSLFWLGGLFIFAYVLSAIKEYRTDFIPAWFSQYSLQIYLLAASISLFFSGWRPKLWGSKKGLFYFAIFIGGYFWFLFTLNFAVSHQTGDFSVSHFTNRTMEQILFASVLAPILEELFFRDILFRALGVRFQSLWLALLFSSAFFMVAHMSLYPGAFLLGIISCFIFVTTRSILGSIIFHSLSNLSYFFIPVWFPGLFRWLVESGWFSYFYR